MTTPRRHLSKCLFCKRRDEAEGGDGTCPIRSSYASWNTHVRVHVNGCRRYKPGDNAAQRPPDPELPPLTMFS